MCNTKIKKRTPNMFVLQTLDKFGYDVKNKNGNTNQRLNFFDVILLIIYCSLSTRNLVVSDPSHWLFWVNAIVLARMIVANMIEQKKSVRNFKGKYGDEIPENTTRIHLPRIVFEWTVLFVTLLFYVCFWDLEGQDRVIQLTGFLVLTLSLVESILKVIERLYEATPKPSWRATDVNKEGEEVQR